ncbi:MAG: DNA polymerase III subunit chi [Geminicoccaceae bacterium]|nr:DNA polymerase III subunit chi [Geminicoccaceae bacterium]
MTELGFYHLTRTTLEQALPRLLTKVLQSGQRALVRVSDTERLNRLDAVLWTFGDGSFLPHGTIRDGRTERQPVLLTTRGDDNPNGARYLFLIDQAVAEDATSFDRCFELFDGRDHEAVAAARNRWRWAMTQGIDCIYWQQDERGHWIRGGASRGDDAEL